MRFRPIALALAGAVALGACAAPASGATGGYQEPPLHQPGLLVCRPVCQPGGGVRRPRRALGGVQVERPRLRQRHDLHGDAADRAEAPPPERRPRHDLELPAPADVLVRADAVRQRVRAGVHEEVHTELRCQRPRGHQPRARNYIGKHPGNAYMELQFYGPGYVPQFEGFGCTAHQYCAAMTIDSRTIDQNTGVGEHRGLRPVRARRAGADQLGLHHPERPLPGTGEPAVHRNVRGPNFSAVNPDLTKDLLMSPGDRIRIHMHDTTRASAPTSPISPPARAAR